MAPARAGQKSLLGSAEYTGIAMWFEWLHHAITSNGAVDAYRPVLLDDTGKLDDSFMPTAINSLYVGTGGDSGISIYDARLLRLKGTGWNLTASATYALPDKLFGILFLLHGTSGHAWVGLLRGGANSVLQWWATAAGIFDTTKDTADRINIYYDAGTSKYTIQNTKAATQTLYATIITS